MNGQKETISDRQGFYGRLCVLFVNDDSVGKIIYIRTQCTHVVRGPTDIELENLGEVDLGYR